MDTVSVGEVVELTVQECVFAGSVSESLSFHASSERVDYVSAFSIDDGGIGVFATETVSGDVVVSVTEGRDLDAEESIV